MFCFFKISFPVFNPPSQEKGGGGVAATPPPPLSDFPSYHFCVFAKIAIQSIYPSLSRYSCIYEKFFKNFSREKSWGLWGLQQPPVLRGKGWQQRNINFRSFHFVIFSFCHNNDYAPEILLHKVDSVKCLLLIYKAINL